MNFDYVGAKKAGLSDEQISTSLQKRGINFDFAEAKKAGITDDQIQKSVNYRLSQQKTEEQPTTPEGVSPEQWQNIQKTREATIAGGQQPYSPQQFALESESFKSRNVEKPKSGLEQFVEGAGNVLSMGAQGLAGAVGGMAGGMIGKKKEGAALFSGAAGLTSGLVKEGYQNIVGRQEQSAMDSAMQPAKDAATAAASSYVFDTVVDNILSPAKNAGSKFFDNLIGKRLKSSTTGEVVAMAPQKALEEINRTTGNAKQSFINAELDQIPWWTQVKDKFNKFKPLGVVQNEHKIAQISQDLAPVLKQAGKDGLTVGADDIAVGVPNDVPLSLGDKDILRKQIGQLTEGLFGKGKRLNPEEALKLSQELASGAYTPKGKAKTAIDPLASRQVGLALKSWIKDNVEGAAEGMAKQRELYLWNNALYGMATKVNTQMDKDFFAGLSKDQLANVTQKIAGIVVPMGFNMPVISVSAGAGQLPQLAREMAGGPAQQLYGMLKKPVEEGVKSQITKQAGIRSIMQPLFGGAINSMTGNK